jgi:hypothetical protein
LAEAWDLVNALERRTRRENQKVIAVAS